MSINANDRVQIRMAEDCKTCGERRWLLTKWQKGNGWAVDIQCQVCGRSGRQPFPKADHPNWQNYPEFDKTLAEIWDDCRRQEREQERGRRSQEYWDWLKTSGEWAELRLLIMGRANERCEACLKKRAVEVHHTTYEFGRLPPAFYLRAVCKSCHDRLHNGWEADA